MKMYSSSFVSVIFAFLMFLGVHDEPIKVGVDVQVPVFASIIEPAKAPTPGKPTVEVFDELDCPECDKMVNETLPQIKQTLIETGRANLRVYLIPKEGDDNDFQAIMAAKCAADQKRFWEMHANLHSEEFQTHTLNQLNAIARKLELNMKEFQSCIAEEKYREQIEYEVEVAQKKGIYKKPGFFINGYKLIGNQPIENLKLVVDKVSALNRI